MELALDMLNDSEEHVQGVSIVEEAATLLTLIPVVDIVGGLEPGEEPLVGSRGQPLVLRTSEESRS